MRRLLISTRNGATRTLSPPGVVRVYYDHVLLAQIGNRVDIPLAILAPHGTCQVQLEMGSIPM
ncbi:MAG TPA: hypothetical protein VKU38_04315 [Ktedonobacteraceae bacterium]|nr:hypothetical protein [Ktedonobacteraceae bacterium]